MNESPISEAVATGDQIFSIVSKIEPTLYGYPRGHVIIALLSITLTIMNPDLSVDEIQSHVLDTSRYMCVLMADTPSFNMEGERKVILN